MKAADERQAAFLRDWRSYVEIQSAKIVRLRGGSPSDLDDIRQAAFVAGYESYLKWLALPDDQRTAKIAGGMVGRAVKKAAHKAWCELKGVPAGKRERGAGVRATILRSSLRELARRDRAAPTRVDVISRVLVGYQVMMAGLLHGNGFEAPDVQLAQARARDRVHRALRRLPEPHARLIEGFYLEGRKFKDVGVELGITSQARLSRMHMRGLEMLRDEMTRAPQALPHVAPRVLTASSSKRELESTESDEAT